MNSLWDAEVVVCLMPQHHVSADKPVKKCYAAVTSTGDLEGFSFSCFLCGWGQWGDRCRSLPSASVASKAASQQRRNKSFISFSSLHVFVAVWQRNHLFPVDGSLPALHTNRVHHVAGGDKFFHTLKNICFWKDHISLETVTSGSVGFQQQAVSILSNYLKSHFVNPLKPSVIRISLRAVLETVFDSS